MNLCRILLHDRKMCVNVDVYIGIDDSRRSYEEQIEHSLIHRCLSMLAGG
jgi:hypothetical protein